jgi:hypothetical protein
LKLGLEGLGLLRGPQAHTDRCVSGTRRWPQMAPQVTPSFIRRMKAGGCSARSPTISGLSAARRAAAIGPTSCC